MGFLSNDSTLKQNFFLPLNGAKYYLMYAFKAVHVRGVLDPETSLFCTVSVFLKPRPISCSAQKEICKKNEIYSSHGITIRVGMRVSRIEVVL